MSYFIARLHARLLDQGTCAMVDGAIVEQSLLREEVREELVDIASQRDSRRPARRPRYAPPPADQAVRAAVKPFVCKCIRRQCYDAVMEEDAKAQKPRPRFATDFLDGSATDVVAVNVWQEGVAAIVP